MENILYVLACASCNKIATEEDLIGKDESEDPVTCSCGQTVFASVGIPESLAIDGYLVVGGDKKQDA